MNEQETELLELVKELEVEIKSLKILSQSVPEETVVAIAAAVAGYLGLRAKRRQMTFRSSRNWQSSTRRSQHSHALYLR
ncbi:MAG: hypothetical protein CR979_02015 [Propionibacterium sp.]|nr:MAG: hypothetical protein CR979_02015 [Propionibacterium sp.]